MTGQMVLLPTAQSLSPDTSNGATVLVGVRGRVAVDVLGETHVIGPNDVLTIPATLTYRCNNVQQDASLFAVVVAKVGQAATPTPASQGDWPDSGLSPVFHPWDEVRCHFSWHLPKARVPGMHRATGPSFSAGTLRGHMVRQPIAQRCPWHAAARDLIFIQLHGEVDFIAAGREWHLEPLDMMRISAETPYVYANTGPTESLFCDVGGRLPGNSRTTYWEADPGWPISTTVPTIASSEGPGATPH